MPECAAIEFEESRTRIFHALDAHSPFKTSAHQVAREISRFGVAMSARRVKSIIYREVERLWHDEVETIRAWSEARAMRQSSKDAALLRELREMKAQARRALQRAEAIEHEIMGRQAADADEQTAGALGRLDARPGPAALAPQEVAPRASLRRRAS